MACAALTAGSGTASATDRQQASSPAQAKATWEQERALLAVVDLVMAAAVSLREMYFCLPEAIAATQPQAARLADEHYAASAAKWGLACGTAGEAAAATAWTAGLCTRLDRLQGVVDAAARVAKMDAATEPPAALDAGDEELEEAPPPPSVVGASGTPLRLLWFRLSEATGFHGWHVALALQITVAFVAGSLLVVFSAPFTALGGDSVWILTSIFVVSARYAGDTIDNGRQRFTGAMLGCCWCWVTTAVAYGVNGGNYSDGPGKLIVIALFTSLYCGFCAAQHNRMGPAYDMVWTQAMVSSWPLPRLAGGLSALCLLPGPSPSHHFTTWRPPSCS